MKSGPLNPQALKMGCYSNHDEMHMRMVAAAKRVAAEVGNNNLLLMSHPDIRPRVLALFKEVS